MPRDGPKKRPSVATDAPVKGASLRKAKSSLDVSPLATGNTDTLHPPSRPVMVKRSKESRGPTRKDIQSVSRSRDARVKRSDKIILSKTFRHCPRLRSVLMRCEVPLECRLHCEYRSFGVFAILGSFRF